MRDVACSWSSVRCQTDASERGACGTPSGQSSRPTFEPAGDGGTRGRLIIAQHRQLRPRDAVSAEEEDLVLRPRAADARGDEVVARSPDVSARWMGAGSAAWEYLERVAFWEGASAVPLLPVRLLRQACRCLALASVTRSASPTRGRRRACSCVGAAAATTASQSGGPARRRRRPWQATLGHPRPSWRL